jgi:hypothetical protein
MLGYRVYYRHFYDLRFSYSNLTYAPIGLVVVMGNGAQLRPFSVATTRPATLTVPIHSSDTHPVGPTAPTLPITLRYGDPNCTKKRSKSVMGLIGGS